MRRPIRARDTRWAATAAGFLTRVGVHPHAISLSSLAFAAALGIQLRRLCNMLDGMVAIEGERRSRSGELVNEFPDRLSDIVVLVTAGYAGPAPSWAEPLGWAAAVLAVLTAYVRAFGEALTGTPHFCGPMAKAHRMAVLTVACLLGALQSWGAWSVWAIPAALGIIIVGGVAIVVRRTRRILAELEATRT